MTVLSQNNTSPEAEDSGYAVEVNNLSFSYTYPGQKPRPALKNISFKLKYGSRCLLLGANGAGKSTLLRILSGKNLIEESQVQVLGKPAFFQTLGVSGITYLGSSWVKTVAFAGNNIPYQADIPVREMMRKLQEEHPERRDHLYKVLEIDPEWRMHEVSDGQRRRVQIMLGLLRPFKVLLLDEMTVDLDVLARRKFLSFLESECTQNNATVIYATHIFDGMENFATDVVMIEKGEMVRACPYNEIRQDPNYQSLYNFVVQFLEEMCKRSQEEKERKKAEQIANGETGEVVKPVQPFAPRVNSGFTSGRMMGYYRP